MAIKVIVELKAHPGRRGQHVEEAAATGTYSPLLELLAEPFRVTVLSRLS